MQKHSICIITITSNNGEFKILIGGDLHVGIVRLRLRYLNAINENLTVYRISVVSSVETFVARFYQIYIVGERSYPFGDGCFNCYV